jgi:hypothetical protein
VPRSRRPSRRRRPARVQKPGGRPAPTCSAQPEACQPPRGRRTGAGVYSCQPLARRVRRSVPQGTRAGLGAARRSARRNSCQPLAPTGTSRRSPGGRGPAWERPGARPAERQLTNASWGLRGEIRREARELRVGVALRDLLASRWPRGCRRGTRSSARPAVRPAWPASPGTVACTTAWAIGAVAGRAARGEAARLEGAAVLWPGRPAQPAGDTATTGLPERTASSSRSPRVPGRFSVPVELTVVPRQFGRQRGIQQARRSGAARRPRIGRRRARSLVASAASTQSRSSTGRSIHGSASTSSSCMRQPVAVRAPCTPAPAAIDQSAPSRRGTRPGRRRARGPGTMPREVGRDARDLHPRHVGEVGIVVARFRDRPPAAHLHRGGGA